MARLQAANVAYGSLNSVADFAAHPQLRRSPVETESGALELIAHPVEDSEHATTFGPVPALGEHSERLRAEFASQAPRRAART